METTEMILATEFCMHHQIEMSFIYSLKNSGLLVTVIIEEQLYIPVNELKSLESMLLFYNTLDINLEGIETVTYLLQKINNLQQQILELNNKLSVYESEN